MGQCKNASNQSVLCGETDALTTEDFRKIYYATITVPVTVGQSQLVLNEYAKDDDHDQDYVCDLEISNNKQFNYVIENKKLTLRDGISTLRLDRLSDTGSEGLLGTWIMQERVGKVLTITKLIFKTLEELKIEKTCKLK